jgi:hypothetical protein
MHILLLGDLHFKGNSKDSELFTKIDLLCKAIKNQINEDSKLLIIVNGDIANRGKVKEFKAAKAFFKNLEDSIKSISNVKKVEYIFNPGNHDCDFDVYDSEEQRKDLYSSLEVKKIDARLNDFQKKLDSYYKFVSFFKSPKIEYENEYFIFYIYNYENINYAFVAYNSVLGFDPKFRTSNMIIDSSKIKDNLYLTQNLIYFSLSHYPIECFDRSNSNNFQQITNDVDIAIFSHEHNQDISEHKTKNTTYVEFKLPAMDATDQVSLSGFSIAKFNLSENKIYSKNYTYNGSIYSSTNEDENLIKKGRRIISKDLSYNTDELNKVLGPKFSLGLGEKRDCFVEPTFVRRRFKRDNDYKSEFIEYRDFDIETGDSLMILIGSQFIGKTTTLKSFINMFLIKGYIPIYINSDHKKNTIVKVRNRISAFIEKIYVGNENYIEQNSDKAVILFDNIHLLKGNTENIIRDLQEQYVKIICSADSSGYEPEIFSGFSDNAAYYDIMHFGNNQKYQLVESWVKKKDFNDDVIENQKIDEIMKIINKIDSDRNFMTTPTLVIIFLQAYDDKKTDKLMNGSKGVYYQYLIDKMVISLAEKTGIETSFIEEYLMRYAHNIFLNQGEYKSSEFNEMFLDKYPISERNYYKNIELLEKAMGDNEVFHYEYDKSVCFSNEIIYSYFVALYYQKKGYNSRGEIYDLIDKIDDNCNANILLFYYYLTKDVEMINRIIDLSNSLFNEITEVRLEEDIKFINDIIYGVKNIEDARNIKGKYIELSKKVDQADYKRKNVEKKHEITIRQKELLVALKIDDIVGEILNLFPEKQEFNKLLVSTINMSLRKSTDLVMYTYLYLSFLSKQTREFFDENEKKVENRLNRLLNTLIIIFVELAENLKIKRFSDSVLSLLDSMPQSIAIETLKAIEKIYLLRGEKNVDYNFIISLKDKMLKEKNKYVVGMIHAVVNREVNYVGMESRAKYILLNKLNAKKLQRHTKDPVKQLNYSRENKKERLKILRQSKSIKKK